MLQTIPTRIAGAAIVRQTASRRTDGSAVLVRRAAEQTMAGALPHEQVITADFGFTCEPSFTRLLVERALRCLEGELYAILVDVRVGSQTFGHWQSVCMTEGDGRTLTVPAGVACGWQVLSSVATIELSHSHEVAESHWRWLPWNDPQLGLQWPEQPERLADHLRECRPLSRYSEDRLPRLHGLTAVRKHKRVRAQPKQNSPAPQPNSDQATLMMTPTPAVRLQTRVGKKTEQELILVVGSSGQLGRDLSRHLRRLGTVLGACRNPDQGSVLPVPMFVDISRPASLRQAIRQVRPTLIVNAASLTDVDQAENEPRLAQLVNATAPAIMADEAQRVGACLVHFCSGMVFSGSGDKPWRESDPTDPQNQFARTKLIGTQAVLASEVPSLILRSGWLYSTHGDNYVRRLIDSLSYRNSVTLADDYLGSPTSTNFLASLTCDILLQGLAAARAEQLTLGDWLRSQGGLYHASTLGVASKLQVGDQIVALCRQHGLPSVLQHLHGRPLSQLPSLAPIPANCALDPTRLAMRFQLDLPRWQTDLGQQIELMLGAHSLAVGVA